MTAPDTPAGVDRTVGRDLAERMTALYAQAEARLAADIARRLAAGMNRPDWAEQKLAALSDLRRFMRTLTERLGRDTEHEITQALLLAYMRGGTEAMRTITRLQNTLPEWIQHSGIDPGPRILEALSGRRSELASKLAAITQAFPGVAAVMRMVGSLVLRLAGTHLPILRWAEDAYREVIAAGSLPGVLLGLDTRRRASQIAWERLLSQGIKGFTDRSGRNWNLASYVEMATRTGVAQAAVEGHLDRLGDARLDLVIVSNAPQECERCRPWEGKILARRGVAGTVTVENLVTGEPMAVEIAGTVDDAIRAGLLHPNCRHSLNAYIPGATKVPTHTEDRAGDAARQRLRELEREVRREKMKAVATIDPAAADRHERKVRDLQTQIRDHVAATQHLGIFRKPERERINLGNAVEPKRRAPKTVKTVAPKTPRPPKAPKKTAAKVVKPKAPKAPKKVAAKVAKPKAPKAVVPPPEPPKPQGPKFAAGVQPPNPNPNPVLLTGERGHWDLPADTGPNPVPVKDLTITGGYVVKQGSVWRIDGVSYLVEHRGNMPETWRIVDEFVAVHRDIPAGGSKYNHAYAWVAGRNPFDSYWAQEYNTPGFESLAVAGGGRVTVWNRGIDAYFGPRVHAASLHHEAGHNIDNKAQELGYGSSGAYWKSAIREDAHRPNGLTFTPSDAQRAHRTIHLAPDNHASYPYGVTSYARTDPRGREDFAESTRLYFAGVIGTGRVGTGRERPLYFRDIFPNRAAILDRLFPEFARQQAEEIDRLRR